MSWKVPLRILVLRPRGLVLPAITSSVSKSLKLLGGQVLEMSVCALAREPGILARVGKRGHLDAVFTLDLGGKEAIGLDIGTLQQELKIPWLVWFVDDPEGYGLEERCDPLWTVVFCWDKRIVRELEQRTQFKLCHLPLGCEPRMLELASFLPIPKEGRRGIFVGSISHPNAFLEEVARGCPDTKEAAHQIWEIHKRDITRPMVDVGWEVVCQRTRLPRERLMADSQARLWLSASLYIAGRIKRITLARETLGTNGVVYGDPAWRELAPEIPYGGPLDYGPALMRRYMENVFVLDIRQPQARTGLTQRVFDGSLCERPVLTEWSVELEGLFEPEREIPTYKSLDEAKEKAAWLRKLPKEAELMAQKAKRRTLANHTYKERAKTIMEAIQR